MINSNEVRRLNWVEFEGRHFQIDVISEVFPTLDTAEFGIGVVDWNNINPILLTAEWLVKFGFETTHETKNEWFTLRKVSEGSMFSLSGNSNCIMCLSYKRDVFDESRGIHEYQTIFPPKPIKHVHSLQNLFHALTGQELTIKND